MKTTVYMNKGMALDQVKKLLATYAHLDDAEAQSFCRGVNHLIAERRTMTAWEASRDAIAPLIAGHPGLRHEQTGDVVHALLAPHVASGAYHVDPVHIGPSREPLLYYPNEAGLRDWLAAHPGAYMVKDGPPDLDLMGLNEAAQDRGIYPQNVRRRAQKLGILKLIGNHPFVLRSKWYELHGIDPTKAPYTTTTKRLPDSLDVEDRVEDCFEKHAGRHFSATELLAFVRKKYPNVDMVVLTDVLEAGKARGDFDQDSVGKWFRTKPEE